MWQKAVSSRIREKKQLVAGASCVVKLHQFSARETGQESPRAFKGLNETGDAQGGGILRTGNPAANCMHTPDRSIHERGRSQDEVTLLHPRLPLHPTVRNFRGDNAVKIGSYFIVGAHH